MAVKNAATTQQMLATSPNYENGLIYTPLPTTSQATSTTPQQQTTPTTPQQQATSTTPQQPNTTTQQVNLNENLKDKIANTEDKSKIPPQLLAQLTTTPPQTTNSDKPASSGGGATNGGGGATTGGGGTAGTGGGTGSAGAGNVQSQYDNESRLQEIYNKDLQAAYDEMKNLTQQSTAERLDLQNQAIDEQVKVQIGAYANQLDDMKSKYAQERAKVAALASQANDNMILRSASNGDRGGIAQKQYNDQAAAYDSQILSIDLQQIKSEQDINQAIEEAKATGNYQKLQYVIELKTAEYQSLINQLESYISQKSNMASTLDNYDLTVQAQNRNNVNNKIANGLQVSAQDMEQLGYTPGTAQAAANYANQNADIQRQLQYANLNNIWSTINARSQNTSQLQAENAALQKQLEEANQKLAVINASPSNGGNGVM